MEQKNGMIVGIFSLVIGVMIVMGMMIPVVSDWTTGERTVNDGAGWLRMNYTTSPSYQGIAADLSGEGVVIYNSSDGTPDGTETLRGTEDTIIYADNNLALWYENDNLFLLGQIDGEPVFVQRDDAISLIRESDGIRVSAMGVPYDTKFPLPTYAYEPRSEGNYAFYSNGTPVSMESGKPNAIVGGGFAGVYAYNDIYRYNGLGLNLHAVYDDDGLLYDAYWDKSSPVEPESLNPDALDPSAINLDPMNIDLDPITLNSGTQLLAATPPTPTYTDGDWGYDLSGSRATIVSYSGTGGNVTVPSTVGGYSVYQFGKGTTGSNTAPVFNNDNISPNTTVTFQEGASIIGRTAFNQCTNISSVTFPESLTTLGSASNSTGPFYGCTGLTYVYLPSHLTMIGGYAFAGCTSLTTITIPNSVTTLWAACFANSGLTGTLTIPDSVTSLRDSVPNAAGMFENCTGLTAINFGSGMTSICPSMFKGCTGLTSITIPSTITAIKGHNWGGYGAFQGCTSLSTVNLPNTLTEIGESTFQECTSLTSISIPDSVTEIKKMAFQQSGITSISLPPNLTIISEKCFYACNLIGDLSIPQGVTTIESLAFYNNQNITSITLPESLIEIKSRAFSYCKGLTEIVLPNSLKYIRESAFAECRGVNTPLIIPDSVEIIEKSAFDTLVNLPSVTLGTGLKELSGFGGCTLLTSIEIPYGVTKIGDYAFSGTSITSIEIPDTVTEIGANAIYMITNFDSDIILPTSVTKIGNNAFAYLPRNVSTTVDHTVLIPNSVTSIGRYCLESNKFSTLIIASDVVPTTNIASSSKFTTVLDLSDTVDYSVNRYGIPSNATVSDSIGDCFGYISFVEIGSDPMLTGSTAALLIAIPLLMVVGLTIAAMTVMRGRME